MVKIFPEPHTMFMCSTYNCILGLCLSLSVGQNLCYFLFCIGSHVLGLLQHVEYKLPNPTTKKNNIESCISKITYLALIGESHKRRWNNAAYPIYIFLVIFGSYFLSNASARSDCVRGGGERNGVFFI